MSYHKILVDNPTCSRRFHITFDDSESPVAETKANCPYCGITIFEATNHAPVRLARQENLIQTAELSDNIVTECQFKDIFSEKSIPTSVEDPRTK